MSRLPQDSLNRRDFFRQTARYFLLGGLAILSALIGAKTRLKGQICVSKGICGGCAQFTDCELPAALSARLVTKGKLDETPGAGS